jgi:hypothetical protein
MSTVEGDKMTNGDQCANRAGSLQAFQRRPSRPTEIEDCRAEDCELQDCNRGEETALLHRKQPRFGCRKIYPRTSSIGSPNRARTISDFPIVTRVRPSRIKSDRERVRDGAASNRADKGSPVGENGQALWYSNSSTPLRKHGDD